MVADSFRVSMVADSLKKVQYVAAVYNQSSGLLVVCCGWRATSSGGRAAPACAARARPARPSQGVHR